MPTQIPSAAVSLVKEFEGLRLTRYNDVAGYPTIGYGHKILPSETFSEPITEEEATALLLKDMDSAASYVERVCEGLVNESQFAACISLAYNIGNGAFNSSSVLRFIKSGDSKSAAEAFLMWNKITVGGQRVESEGLTNRRRREKAHFEL